jgi:hypothetical protein
MLIVPPLSAQTIVNGGRIQKGSWDASTSTRTNNSRQGTGSPFGRDACTKVGESYFQTDAANGFNVWYCTTIGTPGTWVQPSVSCASGLSPTVVAGQLTCVVDPNVVMFRSTAQSGLDFYCKDASSPASSTTYVCTLATTLTAYTEGSCFNFRPQLTNTGSSSLNIGGLGPLTLQTNHSGTMGNLISSDIIGGMGYTVCFGVGTPPTTAEVRHN